jgi:hypothetical protein
MPSLTIPSNEDQSLQQEMEERNHETLMAQAMKPGAKGTRQTLGPGIGNLHIDARMESRAEEQN